MCKSLHNSGIRLYLWQKCFEAERLLDELATSLRRREVTMVVEYDGQCHDRYVRFNKVFATYTYNNEVVAD